MIMDVLGGARLSVPESIKKTILKNKLIAPDSAVVVALSGGADSVALFLALLELSEGLNIRVYAAHLNHMLRGDDSSSDAEFVRELCKKKHVELYLGQEDVALYAKNARLGIEEAARAVRYRFLEAARLRFYAQAVATAHNANDQAETVLMHVLRGSALSGLTGISHRHGNVVRPMLDTYRSDIEHYLGILHQPFVTDKTNLEPCCTRNMIRLDVLPYLEDNINANVTHALVSLGELASKDEAFLSGLAVDALSNAQSEYGYSVHALLALPEPVLTRALKLALARADVVTNIERKHIDALVTLLSSPTGKELILPGVCATISYDTLMLGSRASHASYSCDFVFPGTTATPGGTFNAMIGDGVSAITKNRDFCCADFGLITSFGEPLVVRTRRDGDRFFPLGAPGGRKLKDYLIDKKIPRFLRDMPLICAGEHVLFIPGHGISQRVAVSKNTTRTLFITYDAHKAKIKTGGNIDGQD